MAVQVRSLKAKDARLLAEIISASLGEKLKDGEGKISLTPADFLQIMRENIPALWAFLADLGGMTAEQLDEAEISAPLDIIEALGNSPEGADFFERLFRLFGPGKKSATS